MRLVTLLFALLAASVPSRGYAQSERDDEARTHFESGEAYFQRADYARALEAFTVAYEISGREQMLYNIGLCHERLVNLEEAIAAFEGFLAWQRETGREHVSAEGVQLRIDTLRERAAAADAMDAGSDEAAPNDTDRGEAGEGTPEAPSSSSPLRIPAFVALGVGAAGALTFSVLGGLTLRENNELSECKASRTCASDELDSLRRFRRGADVGLAIGLAGLGAGITLLLLSRRRADERGVSVAPFATPESAGASASVRF